MLRGSSSISMGKTLACAFALTISACQHGNNASRLKASNHRKDASVQCISLLGKPLHAQTVDDQNDALLTNLRQARRGMKENPTDPARVVWVGRRLGYLWRLKEAIDVFTRGIHHHPDYAPLFRHRGHRWISLRRFDEAIDDLNRAAKLIEGKPDSVEPDGMPNDRNIPLTTTAFNVWYHLGLAHYCKGDYEKALSAYRKTMTFTQGHDDNIVATTDWMYMTLKRLGRSGEATALLEAITPNMEIIENRAYHRRLLMYKGLVTPESLLDLQHASDLDLATLGYGVGHWHLTNGDQNKAMEVFRRVTSGPYWPAFGFIAAEVDLARLEGQSTQSPTSPNPKRAANK